MNVLVIIFMIVSGLFALGSLGYVVADVIIEKQNKKETVEMPAPEPEPEVEIEIVESEPVIIPEDMPEPVSAEVGIEVIDVAWPESMARNKIYKYDPNGETVSRGDIVLVPTFDRHRHGEVLRTATVINGNYRIDSFPSDIILKKIVHVVK